MISLLKKYGDIVFVWFCVFAFSFTVWGIVIYLALVILKK